MSIENKNPLEFTERAKKVTKIAVKFGGAAVAIAVAVGPGRAMLDAANPDITSHGEQTVKAWNGEGTGDLVVDNVDYNSNEVPTGDIVNLVEADPRNAEVYADNVLQQGEAVVLPEEVELEK